MSGAGLRKGDRFASGSGADRLVGPHVHVLGEELDAAVTHQEVGAPRVPATGGFFGAAIDRVVPFGGDEVFGHFVRRVAIGTGREDRPAVATRVEPGHRVAPRIRDFADKDRVGQPIEHVGESDFAVDKKDAVTVHASPGIGSHVVEVRDAGADAIVIAVAEAGTHVAVVIGRLVAVLLGPVADVRLRRAPERRDGRLADDQRLAAVLVAEFVTHPVGALDRVVQSRLFDERQDAGVPYPAVAVEVGAGRVREPGAARGKLRKGADIVVKCQADLLHVVGALHAAGGFAGRLDGWQQQPHHDTDDGDNDEQLDEREAATRIGNPGHLPYPSLDRK